jgi:hypothetical protein
VLGCYFAERALARWPSDRLDHVRIAPPSRQLFTWESTDDSDILADPIPPRPATTRAPPPTPHPQLPVFGSPSPRTAGSWSPSWDRSHSGASAPGPPWTGSWHHARMEMLGLPPRRRVHVRPRLRTATMAVEAPSPVTPALPAATTLHGITPATGLGSPMDGVVEPPGKEMHALPAWSSGCTPPTRKDGHGRGGCVAGDHHDSGHS